MKENVRSEADWDEFEATGSIASYLRYKGIFSAEAESKINNAKMSECDKYSDTEVIEDGEPIGYC